jgi:hypothetical protein
MPTFSCFPPPKLLQLDHIWNQNQLNLQWSLILKPDAVHKREDMIHFPGLAFNCHGTVIGLHHAPALPQNPKR